MQKIHTQKKNQEGELRMARGNLPGLFKECPAGPSSPQGQPFRTAEAHQPCSANPALENVRHTWTRTRMGRQGQYWRQIKDVWVCFCSDGLVKGLQKVAAIHRCIKRTLDCVCGLAAFFCKLLRLSNSRNILNVCPLHQTRSVIV